MLSHYSRGSEPAEVTCQKPQREAAKWLWQWQAGELRFCHEVRFDGALMGSLVIRRSLSDFRLTALRMIALAGGVLLLATLASLLLALLIERRGETRATGPGIEKS